MGGLQYPVYQNTFLLKKEHNDSENLKISSCASFVYEPTYFSLFSIHTIATKDDTTLSNQLINMDRKERAAELH